MPRSNYSGSTAVNDSNHPALAPYLLDAASAAPSVTHLEEPDEDTQTVIHDPRPSSRQSSRSISSTIRPGPPTPGRSLTATPEHRPRKMLRFPSRLWTSHLKRPVGMYVFPADPARSYSGPGQSRVPFAYYNVLFDIAGPFECADDFVSYMCMATEQRYGRVQSGCLKLALCMGIQVCGYFRNEEEIHHAAEKRMRRIAWDYQNGFIRIVWPMTMDVPSR